MAGLIDVGILKPELADYGRMEQQRNLLVQQKQQAEMSQMKLEQLKRDQAMLNDLQTKLRAGGHSDNPKEFFKSLIQTGNPDYVAKGYEGLQRYTELERANDLLRKEAPELFGAAPSAAAPAAAPSAAPAQSMMRMQPPVAPAAPVNALGSGTFDPNAAPVNALAPAAAAPSAAPAAAPADRARELRNKVLLYSSSGDPRLKAMADVYKAELQELSKTPPDAALMRQLGYPLTQAGYQAFRDAQRQDRLLTPEELKQKLQIAAAGRAPGTTVTMVQEKAESGARGQMLVDQYKDISKSAGLAAKTLPAIEANLSALNKGFDTGFGKETVAAGASVLAALGVQNAEKFATDTQTFQSNAISAVLQKQLEQKGPQTEFDARRIETLGAQLGKTKQANEFILATAKEQLQRDIEQRNFYDRWYKTNKTYDGAEDAWFSGEGGKSLFDRPGLKKYAISASAASQIPGQRPVAPAANVVTNPQFPGFSIGKP
jgi:hypothetical protein